MNKLFRLVYIIALSFIFTSCRESIEEKMNKKLSEMSELTELGTVEYTISKIIKANDNSFYTVGDRKILFSCKATMKAGIDLSNFSSDNVRIDKATNSVVINLPKAKVLSFHMPADKVQLEYEKVGAMRFDFTVENRNDLLKQAEGSIVADAENLGILKDAEQNARLFFKSLLTQIGFENIVINYN
jgi:hypothetical protein